MKLIQVVFVFFSVTLAFTSCASTRLRNMQYREINAELVRHSDTLDHIHTRVSFSGWPYRALANSPPIVFLDLFMKPNHSNRETLIGIMGDLVIFFDNFDWGVRMNRYLNRPPTIHVEFFIEEGGSFRRFSHFVFFEGWSELLLNCDFAPDHLYDELFEQINLCYW